MDESTHLLSATCDTFISTLEECLRLAKAELTYQLPHHTYPIERTLSNGHSHDLSSPAPISPTGRKTSRSISRNGGMWMKITFLSQPSGSVCQLYYHSITHVVVVVNKNCDSAVTLVIIENGASFWSQFYYYYYYYNNFLLRFYTTVILFEDEIENLSNL